MYWMYWNIYLRWIFRERIKLCIFLTFLTFLTTACQNLSSLYQQTLILNSRAYFLRFICYLDPQDFQTCIMVQFIIRNLYMPSNLNAHMRQIGHYLPKTFLFPCHTHTLFGIDENLLPAAPKSQLYNWWPWNVELSTLLRYWYPKPYFLTLIEKVQFHQYLQSGKLLLLRKLGNNLKKSLRHQKLFRHDIAVNHIWINWHLPP